DARRRSEFQDESDRRRRAAGALSPHAGPPHRRRALLAAIRGGLRGLACAAALLLAACAGGFARPAPGVLRLGETTQAEARERLGPPSARDTIERRGRKVSLIAYAYTTEAERSH